MMQIKNYKANTVDSDEKAHILIYTFSNSVSLCLGLSELMRFIIFSERENTPSRDMGKYYMTSVARKPVFRVTQTGLNNHRRWLEA